MTSWGAATTWRWMGAEGQDDAGDAEEDAGDAGVSGGGVLPEKGGPVGDGGGELKWCVDGGD